MPSETLPWGFPMRATTILVVLPYKSVYVGFGDVSGVGSASTTGGVSLALGTARGPSKVRVWYTTVVFSDCRDSLTIVTAKIDMPATMTNSPSINM